MEIILRVMPSPSLNIGTVSGCATQSLTRSLRSWAEGVLCFILPLSSFLFLSTGPHAWDAALLWTLPVWLCVAVDYFSPADHSMPKTADKEWLLDARLYVLFALQLANIALLLEAIGGLTWNTPADVAMGAANLAAMRVLVGTTSCCSGLAVAHELLHRRAKHLRWMGRILLWTVCYDHFALEHAHGHHRRVGTSADPATARIGERFAHFFKRSAVGQWSNAWRLEGERLQGFRGVGLLLRHRALHGVLMELGLLMLIIEQYGILAMMMFLYQAVVALRMLEAVNYLQHWGLTRSDANSTGICAWSTDSWFTLHAFIGLSRHIDHHEHAGKPCYRLRHRTEGPRLPHGYFVMIMVVRLFNDRYIEMACRELKQTRLGNSIATYPSVATVDGPRTLA
jgi:alkane 1-monooxygenase